MAVIRELSPEELNFMPAGNRSIKPYVTKKLRESIRKYGILRAVVVVRTSLFNDGYKYYLADGQHLFLAAESLNLIKQLPIIVVKTKFEDIQSLVKFISVLNTSQSPWKLGDYIAAYASTDVYISYSKLKAKKIEYKLPYSVLSVIYSGEGKKQAADKVREGQFRVVNEPKSDDIAQYIKDLATVFGRTNSTALTNLAHVMFKWYDKSSYNHSKFKKYIILNLNSFSLATEREMKSLVEQYDKSFVY